MTSNSSLRSPSMWSRVTKAWTSDNGSGGVLFVSVSDVDSSSETVHVIKGSSRVAQETYAAALGRYVNGLNIPAMRIVKYSEPEWAEIKELLLEQTHALYGEDSDAVGLAFRIRHQLSHQLNRPFFHVMDFVKGSPLLCNYSTGGYFKASRTSGAFNPLSLGESLGLMIAFDILINNSDRVPTSVHDNEGNANNIILAPAAVGSSDQSATCTAVAIDTCVATIDPGKQQRMAELYLHRVRAFLSEMHADTGVGGVAAALPLSHSLRHVAEFIRNETCYEMDQADLEGVRAGVRRGVQAVLSGLSVERIRATYSDLCALVPADHDWEGVWAASVALINTDFLCSVYSCFEAYRNWDSMSYAHIPSAFSEDEIEQGQIPFSASAATPDPSSSTLSTADAPAAVTANILLMQIYAARSGEMLAVELAAQLKTEAEKGTSVDFVVFPEGFLGSFVGPLPSGCGGDTDLSPCGELAALAEVGRRFQCYIVCGTVWEVPAAASAGCCGGVGYITCVVIGPDGRMACKYRKRETLGSADAGTAVGMFDTRFGKAAILICVDIENRDFVAETLAEQPVLIFNPTHLVPPSSVGNNPELIYSSWKLALDSGSWAVEHLCSVHNVTVVRVDQAGSGNTFVIAPGYTHYALSKYEERMLCTTSVPAAATLRIVGDSDALCRTRTARQDNSGVRLLYRSLQSSRTVAHRTRSQGLDQSERRRVVAIGSFSYRGRPRGYAAVVRRCAVEVWDVAAVSLQYRFSVTEGESFCGQGGSCALDGSTIVLYVTHPSSQRHVFTRNPLAAAGNVTAAYNVSVQCDAPTVAAAADTGASDTGVRAVGAPPVSLPLTSNSQGYIELCRKSPGEILPLSVSESGQVGAEGGRVWALSWAPSTVQGAAPVLFACDLAAVAHAEDATAPMQQHVHFRLPLPLNARSVDIVHYNKSLGGLLCVVSGESVFVLQLFCNKALRRLDEVLN